MSATWKWIAVFIGCIVVAVVVEAWLAALLHTHHLPYTAWQTNIIVTLREGSALLFLAFAAKNFLGVSRRDLGWTAPSRGQVLLGIGAGLVLIPVGSIIARIIPQGPSNVLLAMFYGDDASRFLMLVVVGLFSPFVQELVFRGLLLTALLRQVNALVAVCVVAVLFGLTHVQGGPQAVVNATVIGLVTGYLYVCFRSLTAPIAAHMMINSTSIVLTWIYLR